MIGKEVVIEDYFKIKTRKRLKKKKGLIVGGYSTESWHPYSYKAFHIKFEDGTEDTVWAHNMKLVSNGYWGY